jgi:hypothetical protein
MSDTILGTKSSFKKIVFELLDNEYSVYKFSTGCQPDKSIFDNDFISITKTKDEISVVAISGSLEHFDKKEDGWKVLKVSGILDFSLIGIISKISTILANSGISIFVISTYNTDYIMVKTEKLRDAIKVLEENGYDVIPTK